MSLENLCTFVIISRWSFLRMRSVSNNVNKKTHFVFNNFFPKNRAVYEIMWENIVTARQATVNNNTLLKRLAFWVTKVTRSEYVILLAFSR